MKNENLEKARKMFDEYKGNCFFMARDGVEGEYRRYQVPKQLEVQWRKENQEEIKRSLFSDLDNETIALQFWQYGDYAVDLADQEGFVFMIQYFEEHKDVWDTNTVSITISAIDNTARKLLGKKQYKKMLKQVVLWLEECLEKPIWIADCYDLQGYPWDGDPIERLKQEIEYSIECYKKRLRRPYIFIHW